MIGKSLLARVFALLVCCCVWAEVVPAAPVANQGQPPVPVFDLNKGGLITDWVILGPFFNRTVGRDANGIWREGYHTDFLKSIGGESKARFAPGSRVKYLGADGATTKAVASLIRAAANTGIVKIHKHFGLSKHQVAYAYASINSPADQEGRFYLGSAAGIKIWINGNLVFAQWLEGPKALTRRQDEFPVRLHKGINSILVKHEVGKDEPWEFVLEAYTSQAARKIPDEKKYVENMHRFQDSTIRPRDQWGGYVINPGKFPELEWDNPDLVKALWGEMPLKVRWFDAQLDEVTSATKPGRYCAYIEAVTKDGRHIRRSLTIYCAPNWDPWIRAEMPFNSEMGVAREVWNDQQETLNDFAGSKLYETFRTTPEGPILLAGLSELKSLGHKSTQLEGPWMREQDYQLALKRRILGIDADAYPPLQMPRPKAGAPAPVLHPTAPAAVGMKADTADRLRRVCEEWAAKGDQPFTALVARRGGIVFHEAFGENKNFPDKPITLETRYPLASITKNFTGIMFTQFMDQGLIDPDDLLGKYLPDFPTTGPQAITIRQCLNHATGLQGHGNWGGMDNAWFDNIVANGIDILKPGRRIEYNGLGFDLVGKVMEIVSGKSIFRLMHENFFQPIGMDSAITMRDMAYGIDCTAENLARLGQLMLNKGAYGDKEFFSPASMARAMPELLAGHYPDVEASNWPDDMEYGFGITWMRHPDPRAGKDGVPAGRFILSRNLFAHGAASSTVLRVDPDHELVIAVSRFAQGNEYTKYLDEFLLAIEASLEK